MGEKRIEFFWDAARPYSYLAATQLSALAARLRFAGAQMFRSNDRLPVFEADLGGKRSG